MSTGVRMSQQTSPTPSVGEQIEHEQFGECLVLEIEEISNRSFLVLGIISQLRTVKIPLTNGESPEPNNNGKKKKVPEPEPEPEPANGGTGPKEKSKWPPAPAGYLRDEETGALNRANW